MLSNAWEKLGFVLVLQPQPSTAFANNSWRKVNLRIVLLHYRFHLNCPGMIQNNLKDIVALLFDKVFEAGSNGGNMSCIGVDCGTRWGWILHSAQIFCFYFCEKNIFRLSLSVILCLPTRLRALHEHACFSLIPFNSCTPSCPHCWICVSTPPVCPTCIHITYMCT